jgi:hypothetical protein
MSIVNLPIFYKMQWADENGDLTVDSALFMDETNQTLITAVTLLNLIADARIVNDGSVNRGTVVNDALRAPQKTTAEITALEPDATIGSIWFNTSLAKLQVKTAAGTVETITSS